MLRMPPPPKISYIFWKCTSRSFRARDWFCSFFATIRSGGGCRSVLVFWVVCIDLLYKTKVWWQVKKLLILMDKKIVVLLKYPGFFLVFFLHFFCIFRFLNWSLYDHTLRLINCPPTSKLDSMTLCRQFFYRDSVAGIYMFVQPNCECLFLSSFYSIVRVAVLAFYKF